MILVFLAIAVVMTFGAVAYYCAIFAMPMWVAMSVFQHVHQSAGVIPSVISAIVAGILSVGLVLMTMGLARNPALRLAALAAFVTPAAIAGYALSHGILKHVESGIALHLLCATGSALTIVGAVRKLNEIADIASGE